MSDPIVFISTHDIKPGKLDEFKTHYEHGAERIEQEKPDTVAFLAYLNEDETTVGTVHVFPDAAAMERHMDGVDDRAARAAEFLEFRQLAVWGSPSEPVFEMMQGATDAGAALQVTPTFVTGYLRLGARADDNP